MRELKFRAWDDQGKYWYPAETMKDFFDYLSEKFVIIADWFNKDAISLEQYTGLNDKNGREIYEGDIVECSFGESGAVEFRHGAYCVVGDDINDMSNWKETAFEVIGNIHENPELLEDKNVD